MIKRTAVRETGVSLHHGSKAPLKPLRASRHYDIEGYKGGPRNICVHLFTLADSE